MLRRVVPALLLMLGGLTARAQEKAADTVIVPLAESSKIIFTVGDPADLEILRHYNFQELFNDILDRLAEKAGIPADSLGEVNVQDEEQQEVIADAEAHDEYDDKDDEGDEDDHWLKSRRGRVGQTRHSYNVDLGTNNYLQEDGQFPTGSELYAVRPWGSWYLGVNSVQRTRLARNIFAEWAMGVSWYSFKFQEDNINIGQDDAGIHFMTDSRQVDFVKSKLSATFINFSLVPVLDFGGHSHKPRVWEGDGGGFRFGLGPYVGYRISSKTKLVYEADGEREKEKTRDDFNLNNLRYGMRLQIGVRSTDLFINYDMNELFAKDKGPALNAVSFGIIF